MDTDIIQPTISDNYFQLILSEYKNESEKKRSFDTRAGLILSFYSAILTIIIKDINIKQIFVLTTPITSGLLYRQFFLIPVFALLVISVFICFFYICKILIPSEFPIYNLDDIFNDTKYLFGKNDEGLSYLIPRLKRTIKEMYEKNNKKSQYLKKAIIALVTSIASYFAYSIIITLS